MPISSLTGPMIYLDANATTPVHPEVFEAMAPYFGKDFGNPSSEHPWGWKAARAVEQAKAEVAELLDCDSHQVFTTSGATESIHWALMGWSKNHPQGKIITSNGEHKATYGAGTWAQHLGAQWKIVAMNSKGATKLSVLKEAVDPDEPTLLTLIHGNNEIGTLNEVHQLRDQFKDYDNLWIHLDCAQTVGKVPISFKNLGVDFLSLSGHKLYAPKGVGALLVKDPKSLAPLFLGGGQQSGLRAGTLNVPGIVALGAACHWCGQHLEPEHKRLSQLRDRIISELTAIHGIELNGCPDHRLPHNVNLTFKKLSMDRLLIGLAGVAFSGSSACSSGAGEPSHVLQAIGRTAEEAQSTIRMGLSYSTTETHVTEVIQKIRILTQT